MNRDMAIGEVGRFLKEEKIPISKIVHIFLIFLRDEGVDRSWSKATLFIKDSSWEEFSTTAGLDVSSSVTMERHLRFKGMLINKIQAFWKRFAGGGGS